MDDAKGDWNSQDDTKPNVIPWKRIELHEENINQNQSQPLSERLPFCPKCMRIDSSMQIPKRMTDSL